MTPGSVPAAALAYEMDVIALFLDLPETPLRPSLADSRQARCWFQRGVPLKTVETALQLGSLRRLQRPAHAPALPGIRSLAYFQPVVEELLAAVCVTDAYREFVRRQLQAHVNASAGSRTGP